MPASARDAVLSRAARLSEAGRTTLDLAALDSRRVDPPAGRPWPVGVALETFDELVSAGLLQAEGARSAFRHELARRAIESEVAAHFVGSPGTGRCSRR